MDTDIEPGSYVHFIAPYHILSRREIVACEENLGMNFFGKKLFVREMIIVELRESLSIGVLAVNNLDGDKFYIPDWWVQSAVPDFEERR